MTIYDDMRGYVHTHDRNGWFDVIAKTTPMYQMIDKADAENAKLRERAVSMLSELRGVVSEGDYDSPSGRYFLLRRDVAAYEDALRELGIEVPE